MKGFVDAGRVWSADQRLADQRLNAASVAVSSWAAAAIIMDLDLAWPESGKPRAHFGLDVSF